MHKPPMSPGERSTRALGHVQPSERLQHLTAQHERLRKKVLRRRRELDRFEADLHEVGVVVSARVVPLLEEALRLDATIHAAFAEILADKKLSRRARADIRHIYEIMMKAGTISPPGMARAHAWDDDPGSGERADRQAGTGSHAGTQPGAEPGDAGQDADASHRGRAAHLRDLRKTFLALADAMHPDKVQCEQEKQTRTEAMKELNQAYREGDLARLLELERAWNLEGKLEGGDGDDPERRYQSLERKNALLAEQLREIDRVLRALRRSEPGTMVVEVRRLRRMRDPDPVATVLEPIAGEIEVLRRLASFVQSFQNGEMSLARFLDGPDLSCLLDADDEELDLGELLDMMREVFLDFTGEPRQHRQPRRKR